MEDRQQPNQPREPAEDQQGSIEQLVLNMQVNSIDKKKILDLLTPKNKMKNNELILKSKGKPEQPQGPISSQSTPLSEQFICQ